eukprot:8203053-Alexandrium_andersonii.AAC.1
MSPFRFYKREKNTKVAYDPDDPFGVVSTLGRIPAGERGDHWTQAMSLAQSVRGVSVLTPAHKAVLALLGLQPQSDEALQRAGARETYKDTLMQMGIYFRSWGDRIYRSVMSASVGQSLVETNEISDCIKTGMKRIAAQSMELRFWTIDEIVDNPEVYELWAAHFQTKAVLKEMASIDGAFKEALKKLPRATRIQAGRTSASSNCRSYNLR